MSYYTIWMGDLPPETRREHVVKFFEDYGSLGGIRLMNNFGFVDFKHKRDAKDAVKDLNGEKLKGCRVRLEMSDGPGNRKSGTSYEETAAYSTKREEFGGFNPRFERPYRTKYGMTVSNLTKKFSWSDLKNFMRQVGEVTYTDAHIRSGENRGEVCFKSRKGLYMAKKKLDNTKLHGRRIRLKIIEDGSRAVGSHKHHQSPDPVRESESRSRSRSRSSTRSRSYSSHSSYSDRSGSSTSRSRSRGRSRSRSRTPKKSKKDKRRHSRSRTPERKEKKAKKRRARSRSRSRSDDDKRKKK